MLGTVYRYYHRALLTLYQPMTHICVMSSHNKPIRIYMGGLILGVNTLYSVFCFFKLFLMVGKGLKDMSSTPEIRMMIRLFSCMSQLTKIKPITFYTQRIPRYAAQSIRYYWCWKIASVSVHHRSDRFLLQVAGNRAIDYLYFLQLICSTVQCRC